MSCSQKVLLISRTALLSLVSVIVEVAKEKGTTPAKVSLAWLFQRPHITAPIIGFSRIEHVEDAVEALEIKSRPTDIKRLEEPYQPPEVMANE